VELGVIFARDAAVGISFERVYYLTFLPAPEVMVSLRQLLEIDLFSMRDDKMLFGQVAVEWMGAMEA